MRRWIPFKPTEEHSEEHSEKHSEEHSEEDVTAEYRPIEWDDVRAVLFDMQEPERGTYILGVIMDEATGLYRRRLTVLGIVPAHMPLHAHLLQLCEEERWHRASLVVDGKVRPTHAFVDVAQAHFLRRGTGPDRFGQMLPGYVVGYDADETVPVSRFFVSEEHRGQSIGRMIRDSMEPKA
jgi:GNAT superfamily N-acetyltransferase